MIDDVRDHLGAEHPFGLLAMVSTLLTVVDPRRQDPFARARGEPPPGPSRDELIASFLDIPLAETTALLTVIAEMVDDRNLAARIQRQLMRRKHRLPSWLDALGPIDVYGAAEMVHVLGDGENVMLAVRTASGHEFSVLVYVDHNLGTVIKDAYVVPEPLASLGPQFMAAADDDPDTRWADLDRAEARARISQAGEQTLRLYPPLESETWPACRPLLEWVLRELPNGGTGYTRPEWSEEAREKLAERFEVSPHGAGLDDDDRDMLPLLLQFACDYGPGDPLRWSPVAVEIVLTDWLPRKVVADIAFMKRAPDLLRRFIRFCHAAREITPSLTTATLAEVDRWEPSYVEAVQATSGRGLAGALAAMIDGDPIDPWSTEPYDYEQMMRDALLEAVGGEEALQSLDDTPLPDEAFAWKGVPDDVHAKVAEVLDLCDRCCDELLDVEYRTASRRLLAAVAAADPAIFRRKAGSNTAAAAICWMVGKTNETFSASAGGLTATELLAWFGIGSGGVSQRAGTMLRAMGLHHRSLAGSIHLASPRFLVSKHRRAVIDRRDRYGG